MIALKTPKGEAKAVSRHFLVPALSTHRCWPQRLGGTSPADGWPITPDLPQRCSTGGKPPADVDEMRHRIGYVIQEGGLFPHLDAVGNVTLLARYLGRDRAWIEGRVSELGALVRIPRELLQRYPRELSGGERQRVALMRALMLDPQVLLLDEPLAALDAITRRELQSELKEVFARLAKTVVLVTHDLHEAAWFGDEIVLMRAGHLVQRGRLEGLLSHPAAPSVTEFVTPAGRRPSRDCMRTILLGSAWCARAAALWRRRR